MRLDRVGVAIGAFFAGSIGLFLTIGSLAEVLLKTLASEANPQFSVLLNGLVIASALASLVGSFLLTRLLLRWLDRPAAEVVEIPELWLDPAAQAERDARIVRRIERVSRLTALAGAGVGVLMIGVLAAAAINAQQDFQFKALFLPAVTGAVGYCFGLAGTCVFAPASFLTGPVGRPYLAKIGTSNVVVARLACLLLGIIIGLPLLGLTTIVLVVALGYGSD